MKRFREFITEGPSQLQTNKGEGTVDVENESVREGINALLAQATACSSLTPYIALFKITKVLGAFHIYLPQTKLSGERGHKVFEINQFGIKTGMTDDGKVVTADPSEYKIYFEYEMNDNGMYDVYCEIIDGQELDEIQDDIDLEEQTVYEALSSFGRAYRNARTSNQGTFSWRGKSYDSELKSRPVQSAARPQSSTVPIGTTSAKPAATSSSQVPIGTTKPTASSTTTGTAGTNSRTTPNKGGPISSIKTPEAGPKATVANAPEVPLPKPKPEPSPNLKPGTVQPQYNAPTKNTPIGAAGNWGMHGYAYQQGQATGGSSGQRNNRNMFGGNPTDKDLSDPVTSKGAFNTMGSWPEPKEPGTPSLSPSPLPAFTQPNAPPKPAPPDNEDDKKIATAPQKPNISNLMEQLSETDSKFTRMLKQRRG